MSNGAILRNGHVFYTHPNSTIECTIDICPIDYSIYGYRPSLSSTIASIVLFALLTFGHLGVGWKYRTWSFMGTMAMGAMWECIGYGGRYLLHQDPFSPPGFKLQIVLLTFAPAFFAAGIYLMLKHLVITFGTQYSILKPERYTHIFISCDFLSLLLQGTGGGLASAGDDGSELLKAGNNTMIAGLVFQVVTLGVFGILCVIYFTRVWMNRGNLNPDTHSFRHSKRFRIFLAALVVAWTTIMIRCIYRVVELVPGWGNPIMQDEGLFIALDDVMCIIAAGVLLICHPGYCFNYRVMTRNALREKNNNNSDSSNSSRA